MAWVRKIHIDGKSYLLPYKMIKKIHKTIDDSLIPMETERWIRHFKKNFDCFFPEPDVYLTEREMNKEMDGG